MTATITTMVAQSSYGVVWSISRYLGFLIKAHAMASGISANHSAYADVVPDLSGDGPDEGVGRGIRVDGLDGQAGGLTSAVGHGGADGYNGGEHSGPKTLLQDPYRPEAHTTAEDVVRFEFFGGCYRQRSDSNIPCGIPVIGASWKTPQGGMVETRGQRACPMGR